MSELSIPNTFKASLPPRKRAKTKEEKEQRRIERILRNRKAAHASREKKRRHVEFLESYVTDVESQLQLFKTLSEQLSEKFYQSGKDAVVDALISQVESLPDLNQRKMDHNKANNADDEQHQDDEDEDEEQQTVPAKGRKAKELDQQPSAKRSKKVPSSVKIEGSPEQDIPTFDMPETPESYMSPGEVHQFSRSNSIVSFNNDSSSSSSSQSVFKQEEQEQDQDLSFYSPSLERDENRYSLDISNFDTHRSLSSSPLPVPQFNLDLLPSSEKFSFDQQQEENGGFTFDNGFVFDELRNPEVITSVSVIICQT